MYTSEQISPKNKRLIALISAAALLLSLPFFAMRFTKEVNWGLFDFLVMGFLLFGTAFILEFILRNAKSLKSRIIFCAIALSVLTLIWAELAVGIFGTPLGGN